ncbi:uncharacterized protein K452DRAFT_279284 [Aplosporella prunicola CBS 121167]|uniref:DUF1989 domain-containing protein n=1 Tax=Aplosporella prunicola CBS 121167 TaxID=1176127 RepID=A0A6A6B0A1_9PEZI|nr:uncharacterized protein K452DRAFT_279284 [Aplosporella prunicola CBS 121167]KAF2136978.1 hypothetical protein K452DRAFT_279284 [Aplosporella prunicola CBS 121167]
MAGERQTIPARHGIATFVPKGHSIKIINTYGTQVVDTWAFALHETPHGDPEADEKAAQAEFDKAQQSILDQKDEKQGNEEQVQKAKGTEKGTDDSRAGAEKAEEQIPKESHTMTTEEIDKAEKSDDDADNKSIKSTKSSRTWGSYIPSIRNRTKDEPPQEGDSGASPPQENEKGKRGWLSYLPSGTSYTSYLPSQGTISAFAASHHRDPTKSYAEQLYEFSRTPVGAASISAATGSGTAGSLYAAYTAYTKLQSSQHPSNSMEYLSLPHTFAATHHLSPIPGDTLLTNLRAPLLTLIEDTSPLPQADQKEDDAGIAGRHGTLLPACDPRVYKQLGLDQNEERGSCAENLVMALRELNQKAGLQGPKAVGADVTVNYAPTPLSLFMNLCIEAAAKEGNLDERGIPNEKEESQDPKSELSSGQVNVKEPRTYEGGKWGKLGEKGGYVKFRAEKDVVVVMSACPMDVGPVNGGRCRAANFVVEEPEEVRRKREAEEKEKADEKKKQIEEKKKRAAEKKKQATEKKQAEKKKVGKRRDSGQSGVEKESKATADNEGDKKKDEKAESAPEPKAENTPEPKAKNTSEPKAEEQGATTSGTETPKRNAPKPGKKKPRKLEKRS